MTYISDSPLDAARFAAADTSAFEHLVNVANAASTDDDLLNRDEFADFVWNLIGVRIDRAESTRLIESYAGPGANVVSKDVIIEGMTVDGLLVPPNPSAGQWSWTMDKSAIGGASAAVDGFRLSDGDAAGDAQIIANMSLDDGIEVLGMQHPAITAILLNEMAPEDAAALLNHMPHSSAREVLRSPYFPNGPTVLGEMPAVEAAALLEGMEPDMTMQQPLDRSGSSMPDAGVMGYAPTYLIVDSLTPAPPSLPRQYITSMPADKASNILSFMHPSKAAEALREIADPAVAGHLMDGMAPSSAKEALAFLSPAQSATLLANMPAGEAAEILDLTEPAKAAEILEVMDTGSAAAIIISMAEAGPEGADRAADLLSYMQGETIANILIAVNDATGEQLSGSGRTLSGDRPAAGGPNDVTIALFSALAARIMNWQAEINQPSADGQHDLPGWQGEMAGLIDRRDQVEGGLGLVMGALPGAEQAADIPPIVGDAAAASVDSPADVLALMGAPVYGQPDSQVLLDALYRAHDYDTFEMAHDVGGRDPQGVADFLSNLPDEEAARILGTSSLLGSDVLPLMDPHAAMSAMVLMNPDQVSRIRRSMSADDLAPILAEMSPAWTAAYLGTVSPERRRDIIQVLVNENRPAALAIVGEMDMRYVSTLVNMLDLRSQVLLLPQLPRTLQERVLERFIAYQDLPNQDLRNFIRDSPPEIVTQIISAMDDEQIDLLMAELHPDMTGQYLLSLPSPTARLIFDRMDPVDRAEIIGLMAPIDAARMMQDAMSPHSAAQTAETLGVAAMTPIQAAMRPEFLASHGAMLDRRAAGHEILALPEGERAAAFLAIPRGEAAADAAAAAEAVATETAEAAAAAAARAAAEQGAILLALDPDARRTIMASLESAQTEAIISSMSPQDAADVLSLLDTGVVADILTLAEPATSVAILNQMPQDRRIEVIVVLPGPSMVQIVPLLNASDGARVFQQVPGHGVAAMLITDLPADAVARIFSLMDPSEVRVLLSAVVPVYDYDEELDDPMPAILAAISDPAIAARIMEPLDPFDQAGLFESMPTESVINILRNMPPALANSVIGMLFNHDIPMFAVPYPPPDADAAMDFDDADMDHDELK
jgi:Mg/Co/Ni transporter MgtE